jgi:hypothetical protein
LFIDKDALAGVFQTGRIPLQVQDPKPVDIAILPDLFDLSPAIEDDFRRYPRFQVLPVYPVIGNQFDPFDIMVIQHRV